MIFPTWNASIKWPCIWHWRSSNNIIWTTVVQSIWTWLVSLLICTILATLNTRKSELHFSIYSSGFSWFDSQRKCRRGNYSSLPQVACVWGYCYWPSPVYRSKSIVSKIIGKTKIANQVSHWISNCSRRWQACLHTFSNEGTGTSLTVSKCVDWMLSAPLESHAVFHLELWEKLHFTIRIVLLWIQKSWRGNSMMRYWNRTRASLWITLTVRCRIDLIVVENHNSHTIAVICRKVILVER